MLPPNQWADAERALRQAYATDPGSLPRQPVAYCWWYQPGITVELCSQPLLARFHPLRHGLEP